MRVEMFDHEKMGEDRSMGSFAVAIREQREGEQAAFALRGTLFDKRPAVCADSPLIYLIQSNPICHLLIE